MPEGLGMLLLKVRVNKASATDALAVRAYKFPSSITVAAALEKVRVEVFWE